MVSFLARGAFLLALGFVGLRLGTPYVLNYEFTQLVQEEVDSHAIPLHPSELQQHIVRIGRELGLNLTPADVLVEPLPHGSAEVRVYYGVPIDLFWYEYKVVFIIVAHPRAFER